MLRLLVVGVSAVLLGGVAWAAEWGLGGRISPFTLADQNGVEHRVDANVRVIILSPDMDAGDVVKIALARHGKGLLTKHDAVYLADVSGMPGMVRRMFVLPKLKERPYPMLLDAEGDIARKLPRREGFASLIFLDRLRVGAVEYVGTADGLIASLKAPKNLVSKSSD